MPENWQTGGFGLYVHWPFCSAKCPYCDFNSHVSASVDHDAWADALVDELLRASEETPNRVLSSIFFGGGTPSLMAPETVDRIISTASKHWSFANDIEITLEANPTSVESGNFQRLAAAGVNRLSLGIQALNDSDLQRLGRLHTASEAKAALEIAQKTMPRVSFDLIYARQYQSLLSWEKELKEALSFGAAHLSLYQLTVEPGTVFSKRFVSGKLLGLPEDDLSADMYDLTQQLCNFAGLHRYEVSNHSKPGEESRHNLVYWRCGDYIGVGPGAHGRISVGPDRFATEHTRLPVNWLTGPRERERNRLSRGQIGHEFLLMGLRLAEGINVERWQEMTALRLDSDRLSELHGDGLVNYDGRTLRVSNEYFIVLNAVLSRVTDCIIQN